MFQASFLIRFLGDCVLCASCLINRTPMRLLNSKTPYEMLFGATSSYAHLKVCGYICYAHALIELSISLMNDLKSVYFWAILMGKRDGEYMT